MKCRLYKKEDSSVAIEIFPNGVLDLPPIPENMKEYPSIECFLNEVESIKEGQSFHKLYFDGECKIENLKYDQEWKILLMPFSILKQKTIKRLKHKIDFAFAAEDFEQFNKSNFYLNKALAEKNINYFYQESLNYLTENKIDKPVITKKLKDALGIKETEEALFIIKIPENHKIYEPIAYKEEDQIVTTGFIQPDISTIAVGEPHLTISNEESKDGEENSISSDQSPIEKTKKKGVDLRLNDGV